MKMWRIGHWKNISMSIEILCILNVLDTTQVYTSHLDLASFSRWVSAREPCGQFWDENEKLCWALASILLGSRCPQKHRIESRPIGVDCAPRIEIFIFWPFHPFRSGCLKYTVIAFCLLLSQTYFPSLLLFWGLRHHPTVTSWGWKQLRAHAWWVILREKL